MVSWSENIPVIVEYPHSPSGRVWKTTTEVIESHPSPLALPHRAYCMPSLILREGQKGSVSDVARPLPNETSIGFSLDLQGR